MGSLAGRWDTRFADPQVAAASPIAISTGAIGGGNSTAFRVYWLFIWVLGPLGLLLLARHLGDPRWGAFLVALGVRLLRFLYGTCRAYNCSLFFLVRALVHLAV